MAFPPLSGGSGSWPEVNRSQRFTERMGNSVTAAQLTLEKLAGDFSSVWHTHKSLNNKHLRIGIFLGFC